MKFAFQPLLVAVPLLRIVTSAWKPPGQELLTARLAAHVPVLVDGDTVGDVGVVGRVGAVLVGDVVGDVVGVEVSSVV